LHFIYLYNLLYINSYTWYSYKGIFPTVSYVS